MPSLTAEIRHNSPLSRRILNAVSQRVIASRNHYSTRHKAWRDSENSALAYLHESEIDRKKAIARDYYGKPELTEIRVP